MKVPRITFLAFAAVAMLAAQPSFAQVKPEKPATSASASSRSDGAGSHGTSPIGSDVSDQVLKWCQGSNSRLDFYRTAAETSFNEKSDYPTTITLLVRGLKEALDTWPSDASASYSLTRRAIERGGILAEAVQEAVQADPLYQDTPSLKDEFVANYLFRYYDFINTASDLDTQYYVKYRFRNHCRAGCDDFDHDQFERRFIAYAQAEFDWLLDVEKSVKKFISEQRSLRVQWAPIGSPKAFLVSLEHLAAFTADDLEYDNPPLNTETSLFAARYACTIGKLRDLSSILADYNAGNHLLFLDDGRAVDKSYDKATKIYNGFASCQAPSRERE